MKAISNLRKHGVDFADAATVLHDDLAISIRDEFQGEERFVTIGMDALGRVLVVVLTWHEDRIRIISARGDPDRASAVRELTHEERIRFQSRQAGGCSQNSAGENPYHHQAR